MYICTYIRSAHEATPRGQFSPPPARLTGDPPGTINTPKYVLYISISRGSEVNVAVCSQQMSKFARGCFAVPRVVRHEGRAAPRLGEHGAGEAWIRCRLGGHGEILRARLGGEAVVGCGSGKGRGEVCTYSGGRGSYGRGWYI